MYIDECILKLLMLNLKNTKISIFGIKSFIQNKNSKHTKQYCIWIHSRHTHVHVCSVAQSRPTLCDPTDCSLSMDCPWTISLVHGIIPAGILKWVAISYFRESPWPRDHYCISCIGRWILYLWTTWTHTHKRHPQIENAPNSW